MKRGGKPRPTHLRVIEGNPSHRPYARNEPKPEICLPDPPKGLKGIALEEWTAIASELYKLQLLSKIDHATLAAYCQSYAVWHKAVTALNAMAERDELTEGLMIKTKAGNLIQNPVVGTMNKAATQMVRFAAEFGMTPSARSRISLTDGLAQTPLARLLNLPKTRA